MATRKTLKTILIGTVVALSACRPTMPDSGTKSLDGLVSKAEGDDAAVNRCGAPYTAVKDLPEAVKVLLRKRRIHGAKAAKKEVAGTLVAVPVELLRIFAAAGGSIRVMATKEAAQRACRDTPLADTERDWTSGPIQSCWLAGPSRIVLPPDAGTIRHDLLRQLSYFFTEYLVDGGRAHSGQADAVALLDGVADSRAALAAAFMEDIATANPTAHERLSSALSAERRGNYVYAEALDSYYCSDETRAVFKERFPMAWALFTDQAVESSPVRIFGD